jgi:hypothetical protein
MYIETSSPRKKGDKARFQSPSYASTKASCFQFWYHMYGRNIGILNIYIKKNNQLGNPVWTRSGNMGNKWKISQFSVTSTTAYQV